MTLNQGFVVMGTPSGVGHARTPPIWMNEGDKIEVEIEQIGILRESDPARGRELILKFSLSSNNTSF